MIQHSNSDSLRFKVLSDTTAYRAKDYINQMDSFEQETGYQTMPASDQVLISSIANIKVDQPITSKMKVLDSDYVKEDISREILEPLEKAFIHPYSSELIAKNKSEDSPLPIDTNENIPEALTETENTSTEVDPSKNGGNNHIFDKPVNLSEEPEESVKESGFIPVLKNRNFLALWGGQIFSQLADKVYLVLVIALIANRFQAEQQTISGWVSAIMIAFTIPAVLFGSVAGAFVDRWPKKWVMVVTNLLRGGLLLAMPPLLWISQDFSGWKGIPFGFYIILAITFLVSTLTQFFAPAEQSAIPMVVAEKHLLSANSLYTMTMMASVIIGFAVGEPVLGMADMIVAHLGLGVDIGKELVVGGCYAIAGLLLMLIKTGENTKIEHESPHIWQDLKDGVMYLGQQSRVRNALIQLLILFSIFAALSVLAVRLAAVLPGIKASQFGFLMAAGGLGLACGATILGHWGQRFSHNQLSLFGSVGMAASLVGIGVFTQNLWLSLLLTMSLGCFGALIAVPMQTTIQAETPDQMRGKVFGLQNNVINIALSLPLALAGVAETLFGLQTVFLGLAAIAISGGVLTWYISRNS